MRDYTLVANTMERIIYKYMETEKMSRDYGTGNMFTQVEIHTIEAIGNHDGINITTLATIERKTKGAVSQMIYKLVDKGLVEKNVSKNSDSEVTLNLTPMGKEAYEGHKKFHLQANDEVFKTLREMPEGSYNDLKELLSAFENFLDKQISEK
ncbi:MarR family winged helix-turn-helix transcriptional regulator [Clostridium sp. CH2]|uniref:MarR family winged helix-turn-helix transcriptional regulator n=1 Tax=Clostridium sp. CH2 TaxID=2949990 RepID=UPI00207AD6B2|nr:MarR family winged helix-turn-helix transcriptional regulator [Clostridium sp. CH2]